MQKHTQALYEIALEIGFNIDLEMMLKRSIQTIVDKLNCLGGVVFADRCDNGHCRLEEVFAMPRRVHRNPAYATAIEDLPPADPPGTDRTHWPEPQAHRVGDVYFYCFDLTGFGVLVLLKARPLDCSIVRSIKPICDKLAESCIACETTGALAESQESLRTTLNSIGDAVISTNTEGNIVRMNPVAERLTGWKQSEARGKLLTEVFRIIDARSGEKLENPIEKVLKSGSVVGLANHTKLIARDGNEYQIADSAAPIRDDNGNIMGTVLVFRDVTQEYRTRKALSESEGKLRAMFNASPLAIVLLDRTGRVIDTNEEHARRLRTTRDQLIGRCIWDCLPESVRAHRKRDVENVFEKGELFRGEDEREGTWNEYHVYPAIRNENGEVEAVIVEALDITDRKRADIALKESETRFRTILENLPGGVFAHDMDGRFVLVNQAACRNTGYSREELMAMSVQDVDPASVTRDDRTRLWHTLNQGESFLIESKHVRKDGSQYPAEIRLNAVTLRGEPIILATAFDITERKQLEEERIRVAQEWQTTFDATKDVLWILDRDNHILRTNRTAETLFHRPREEMIGKRCWEITHGTAQLIPLECPFERARKNQRRESMEMQIGENWYEVTVDPILEANREYAGAVHIISDITERKRTEEALRESEANYRTIFDTANDAIFIHDMQTGEILDVNQRMLDMYGYTEKKEVVGQFVSVLSSNEAPYTEQDAGARVQQAAKGKPQIFEWHAKEKNGQLFWVEVNLKKVNLLGQPRIVALVRDITERKRAEEALRDRERFLEDVFDGLQDGISVLDRDLNIVRANTWMERMYAHQAPLKGKKCYVVYQQRDTVCPWCPSVEALSTGETHSTEVPYPNEEKPKGWIDLSAFPLRNEHGEVTGVIEYVKDISDRKRAEEEREKLQSQLAQAQKMESVGRLAGGVAHDFNNMLGVILGHAEMALEQVDNFQPLHTDLREIVKAAERSAALTRQLLAFARKQTVSPKVLDLNKTVEGALKMLRRLIGEDIDLVWQPGTGLWPVKIDPGQIDQLLANLCVNARDAIQGIGKITIETANVQFDDAYCLDHAGFIPGEYAQIIVSDNGCGMDKDTVEHVFDPFFTTKKTGEGTGLGLATVYGIVKQNEGFINVYSEPGEGTCFKIYLQRHLGKAEQSRTEGTSEPDAQGHETVLLVEDEPTLLRLSKTMLERLGYRVLAAGSPGEAIALAEENVGTIHLLMTDVIMPEMNGRDLARRLLSFYPDMKRLFMSGYTANVIAHHGVLDEGVHFIQKPFSLRPLGAKIREVLDQE